MARTRPTETIETGTERHDFAVADDKGRAVGANVFYTLQVMEEVGGGGWAYTDVKPGTYLTAHGRATRAGKPFGAITGAFARFEITDTPDGEVRATAAREAWVAEYLQNAKARALKNFKV